jgi:hypothetical protein
MNEIGTLVNVAVVFGLPIPGVVVSSPNFNTLGSEYDCGLFTVPDGAKKSVMVGSLVVVGKTPGKVVYCVAPGIRSYVNTTAWLAVPSTKNAPDANG